MPLVLYQQCVAKSIKVILIVNFDILLLPEVKVLLEVGYTKTEKK